MSDMALAVMDTTLEAFANTQSQMVASKDVPRGAILNLDPQRGEGNRQASLPELFTLEEMVSTTFVVYPLQVEVSMNRSARGGARLVEASGVVHEVASLIYQSSLFLVAMASHADFSPVAVFR